MIYLTTRRNKTREKNAVAPSREKFGENDRVGKHEHKYCSDMVGVEATERRSPAGMSSIAPSLSNQLVYVLKADKD